MAWTYKEGWHFTMRLSVVLTSSVYRWPLVFIVNLTGVAHHLLSVWERGRLQRQSDLEWVCVREGVCRDGQVLSVCVREGVSRDSQVWDECVWERGHLQRQSGLGWMCVCERHLQRWSGLECVWERSLQRQSALEWVCVRERASPEMISSWIL